jgi:hypothetical protein
VTSGVTKDVEWRNASPLRSLQQPQILRLRRGRGHATTLASKTAPTKVRKISEVHMGKVDVVLGQANK